MYRKLLDQIDWSLGVVVTCIEKRVSELVLKNFGLSVHFQEKYLVGNEVLQLDNRAAKFEAKGYQVRWLQRSRDNCGSKQE